MNYSYPPYQNYPQYQQFQPQQTIQQPQQPVSQNQNIVMMWVTSEDTVRNFLVPPGGSAFFMHENEPYLYMKSADSFGKSTIIKKKLIDETPENENQFADFIKREEIEDIVQKRVREEVEKRMSEISFKPTKPKKTVIVEDED